MSAEGAAVARSWSVGPYTATLTVPQPKSGQAVAAIIEWSPRVQQRLTDEELAAYRRGRNAAVAELSAALGVNAAVVDL